MKRLLTFLFAVFAATAVQAEFLTATEVEACRRQMPDMDNGANMCLILEALDDNMSGTTTSTGAYDIGYAATGNFAGANVGDALDDLTEVTGAGSTGAEIIGVDVTTVTGTGFNCTTVEGCLVELTAVTGAATTGSQIIGVDVTTITGGAYDTCVNVEECLVELGVNNDAQQGANIIGYDDSGSKTTMNTVADVLDEVYTNLTATKVIPISITSLDNVAGAATSVYAAGAPGTDGFSQIGGKEVVFKTGDDTNGQAAFSIALPFDWSTAAWEVHTTVLGDGAVDAVDVECWLSRPADINNTDAITTAAQVTTNAVAEYVFVAQDEATYSAANAAANFHPGASNPVFMTCEITLVFDNFDSELYAVWIEYTPEL